MVIILHINENLKNFIFDLSNYIALYDDCFYAFNYQELIRVSKTSIILKFNTFKVEIEGNDFIISKMTKQELKINGKISNMRFTYD